MNKKDKYKNIIRMCEACQAYTENKMTMKQVWHRVRGNNNFSLIQEYPDKSLGGKLLWLALDFETWSGDRNDIIEGSIFKVAHHLQKEAADSSLQ
jgi:hypothetical protein